MSQCSAILMCLNFCHMAKPSHEVVKGEDLYLKSWSCCYGPENVEPVSSMNANFVWQFLGSATYRSPLTFGS